MQQILQKICLRNVSVSFSNKDIGTVLCFFAFEVKFCCCHAAALILNFHNCLKPTQKSGLVRQLLGLQMGSLFVKGLSKIHGKGSLRPSVCIFV